MMELLIGLIGAVVLIIGWAFETVEAVRRHKSLIDLRFSINHFVGVSLLFVYSFLINDAVFIYLNGIIVAIIAIEIWYSLHIKKVHKNKPHSKEGRRRK
ncbi:MAG: hypothetical protein HY512_00555 [Candidatus Aenigmarchaeota archaeon]|nr:hypothetical protein [Candidatus Aenigmarchaeota archaeon]